MQPIKDANNMNKPNNNCYLKKLYNKHINHILKDVAAQRIIGVAARIILINSDLLEDIAIIFPKMCGAYVSIWISSGGKAHKILNKDKHDMLIDVTSNTCRQR